MGTATWSFTNHRGTGWKFPISTTRRVTYLCTPRATVFEKTVAADLFLAFVCEMTRHVDGKKEIERVSTIYCMFADFGYLVESLELRFMGSIVLKAFVAMPKFIRT
jgi:hypothetical protein